MRRPFAIFGVPTLLALALVDSWSSCQARVPEADEGATAAADFAAIGDGSPVATDAAPKDFAESPFELDLDVDDHAFRGQMTLGLQISHTEGVGGVSFLKYTTDTQVLHLGVDYWLNPRWRVHASLPFIRKRAVDAPPVHNPARLAMPHPGSAFLDDGDYHSSWQDWQLGLAYQTVKAGFAISPYALLGYPSHDYTFFAAAGVGQKLRRLRLGVDVSRRLGQSNFHYSAGYGYEFVEKVLDTNLDRHYLNLGARYDFSPDFSANAYVRGYKGSGREGSTFFPELLRGTEIWYRHDQLLAQNYAIAGIGASWQLNPEWAITASAGRMVWVEGLQKLTYSYELGLVKNF